MVLRVQSKAVARIRVENQCHSLNWNMLLAFVTKLISISLIIALKSTSENSDHSFSKHWINIDHSFQNTELIVDFLTNVLLLYLTPCLINFSFRMIVVVKHLNDFTNDTWFASLERSCIQFTLSGSVAIYLEKKHVSMLFL